jgi:hypothetical protein
MFSSKCNTRGKRTFFDDGDDDDSKCYIKHGSRSHTSTINSTILYDFNVKIKYISQSLNRIVYYDYCIEVDVLQREYNIMIFELNKLKILSPTNYQLILTNIITNFDSLLQIYKKYIDSIHNDNIILPDLTYDNITALELFIASLREKTIPLIYNDKCHQDLELVLFKLYTNVGKDLEQLLKLYAGGNFAQLHEELTYEVYSKLSVALFNESFTESFGYTKVWEVINSCLDGLYKTTLLEKSQRDEIYLLKAKIKLLEKQCNGGGVGVLLEGTATMTEFAQIRPEVKIYISKYGFPVGGVFDSIKLAEILTSLGIVVETPAPCHAPAPAPAPEHVSTEEKLGSPNSCAC